MILSFFTGQQYFEMNIGLIDVTGITSPISPS